VGKVLRSGRLSASGKTIKNAPPGATMLMYHAATRSIPALLYQFAIAENQNE
jgi:hypothetical protein